MNKKGYSAMSIRKEVIEEIKQKAKEEGKTISVFLSELLQQRYSNKEEGGYSNNIATGIKEIKEELIKEELKKRKEKDREIEITKQDLVNVENEIVDRIKDMMTVYLDTLKY